MKIQRIQQKKNQKTLKIREKSYFFDQYIQSSPWPKLLRSSGYIFTYKPREVKQKNFFDRLGFEKSDFVLDVGCGSGLMLARLYQQYHFKKGIGVDISVGQIHLARKINNKNLKFYRISAENLPFGNDFFDVVLCFDALEHISHQNKAMADMIRVLKPGGRFLLYTISNNQKYTWNWLLTKFGVDIYHRVDHDPKLFPDSKGTRKFLVSKQIKIAKFETYNSFFTLALDEFIMLIVSLMKILKLEKYSILGKIFLVIFTAIARSIGKLAEWLDYPWKLREYSNSFFILGKKYEK